MQVGERGLFVELLGLWVREYPGLGKSQRFSAGLLPFLATLELLQSIALA